MNATTLSEVDPFFVRTGRVITVVLLLVLGGISGWQVFPKTGKAEVSIKRPDIQGIPYAISNDVTFPSDGISQRLKPAEFASKNLKPRVVTLSYTDAKVYLTKFAIAPPGDGVDYYISTETIYKSGFGRSVDSVEIPGNAVGAGSAIKITTDRALFGTFGTYWSPPGNLILVVLGTIGLIVIVLKFYNSLVTKP